MINVRNIVYFLVAAVILFALAAIIASRSGGSSAEIQYTTCTMTQDEHDFDVKATVTGPDWGKLPIVKYTSDIRVSGNDIHMVDLMEGASAPREHIVKDGTYYTKPPGGVWEPPPGDVYDIRYVDKLVNSRPLFMWEVSEHILCDREGPNRAKIGRYQEEMIMGPEYAVGPNNELGLSPEELAEIPDTLITWEFWVGSDGKIEKNKQTYAVVGGEDWEMRQTTAEISGVGEPNTITAPTLGSS